MVTKSLRPQFTATPSTRKIGFTSLSLTEDECIDLMKTAESVEDWNGLREIVKMDYEHRKDIKKLTQLMYKIDGFGLIVETLSHENQIRLMKQRDAIQYPLPDNHPNVETLGL